MKIKLFALTKIAVKSLRRNPMRSILTTLGIVVGIGAVVAMIEIGEGSSEEIKKKISSMGANSMVIIPKTASTAGVTSGAGTAMTLRPEDCEAVLRWCPSIRSAAPIVRARAQVIYKNRNWVPDSIEGSTPRYLNVREWSLKKGYMFTDFDVISSNRVCLLGQTLVDKLFEDESPVGKTVRLRNVSLRVIGVLSKKGANLMGQDQDDILLAPWTTIKYRIAGSRLTSMNQSEAIDTNNLFPVSKRTFYPDQSSSQMENSPFLVRFANIDAILTAARSPDLIDNANNEITQVLRNRHKIGQNEEQDFEIINLTEITKALSSTTVLMTNLLLGIAAISLVVGGVGIMNIMLVSVTERTAEIGLRMAMGARSWDILQQFLMEAIALCLVGGIMGIIFGNSITYLVWHFFHWPIKASPLATVTAVIVSASVGIIFGFYPAWKASRLNPIEALQYE
jgi:ABC-type antimicrobial peptide transport system permease subunit